MFKRLLYSCIVLSIFLYAKSFADTVVFEKTYIIERHHSLFSVKNFHADDPGAGTMTITKNQSGKAIMDGNIWLNGKYFHLKHFLKSKEQVLRKDITIKSANRLIVSLKGKAHSSLSVVIKRKGSTSPSVTISANPASISAGETSTLSWSSANAATCSIDQGIGTVAANGTQDVLPTRTTTYTITATGPGGTATASATITVISHINVTITSPTDGASINGPSVMVKGTVTNSLNKETGVKVNGIITTVSGNEYVVNKVLLAEGVNTITVTAVDTTGDTVNKTITVNATTEANNIRINVNPEAGISPLEFTLRINGSFTITNPAFSYTGPGNIEQQISTNPDEYKFKAATEGIYYISAQVTGPDNNVYQDTVSVTVLPKAQIDNLLKSKWQSLINVLQSGDTSAALNLIHSPKRAKYRTMFDALGDQLPSIIANYTGFSLVSMNGNKAWYDLETSESSGQFVYRVVFVKDENGLWCIRDF